MPVENIQREIKTSFTKDFSKVFKNLDISKRYISGINEEFEEMVAEAIGVCFSKSVWFTDEEEVRSLTISKGREIDLQDLLNLGYSRVERVWNEGEFSVLGDVLMLWPFSMKNVLRVSLFDGDVEFIDLVSANSRKKIERVNEKIVFAPNNNIVIGNEEEKEELRFERISSISSEDLLFLNIANIPMLANQLGYYKQRGFKIWYLTENSDRSKSGFEKILSFVDQVYEVSSVVERDVDKGFVYLDQKLVVLTDLEVLGELDLSRYQEINKNIDPNSLDLLKKVIPGEYIVHEDHGIGKFVGLQKRANGNYIEIHYAGKDKLYVPLSAAEKLTKYIGAGRARPRLTGLNSGMWKRISKKAQERVEEVAKELLQLYALREVAQASVVFETDGMLNDFWSFAKSFEFEDTEDQLLATKHIEQDFDKGYPMDRLLVGDVGFGKTEIAMRAMFAVVNSGLQVAVLAPTTILVKQHLEVFRKRFERYPFNIVSLSRFSTEKEKEEVLEGLRKGTVDIVVGTHALLSKSIKFKDLGLLVIDEEQKFGVRQKETIKSLRVDTNVMSLTATPIPRTLNMALAGIRDITVLATPPEGRKSIINAFDQFDWNSVETAIQKEIERGGQVYYLHNRVGTIDSVGERLSKMFPQNTVEVAHGQMSVQNLSETMGKFVKGDIDILVCTTIIENGLDIPTANTLIVDDASKLGLSQMYQIRGRIGRSKKQAYAYFYYTSLKGNSELRLRALKESESLGSGFVLSNRDLEIRGAGDILGSNQSGAINSVGYGLYTQMLQEAVEKLKQ
jgi:transcription-repair coupling factor (superfamily II helicase)